MISRSIKTGRILHNLFDLTVVSKALEGFTELIAGVMLWFASAGSVSSLVGWLFWRELAEDPSDFLANYLTNLSDRFSYRVQFWLSVYFLLQGLAKIFLSVAVFKGRLWAFRWYQAFLAVILSYQFYHWLIKPSGWLAGFIMFDCLTIWLIQIEYKKRRLQQNIPTV